MSEIRISISKTNYNTTYSTPFITQPGNYIDVEFNAPPEIHSDLNVGMKILLQKPATPWWDGEYYIQEANHAGAWTTLRLRMRGGEFISPAGFTGAGSISIHSYNWIEQSDIGWDGKIKHEKIENLIFSRKKISKALIFKKESYNFINSLRQECYSFLIYVKIEKKCDGIWVEQYIGAFTINDVKWDLKTCTAEITPFTFDEYYNYVNLSTQQNIMDIVPRYSTGFPGNDTAFGTRFIKLFDMLDFFVKKHMPNVTEIVSDFFNINPAGFVYPAPIDITQIQNVMLQAMDDCINPTALNPTTKKNFSFKELLDGLRILFDVHWVVVNGKFYLENYYYFMTTPIFTIEDKIINYRNIYQYNTNELIRKEIFKYEQSEYLALQADIVYIDALLINQNGDNNQVKEYTPANICTDINWPYNAFIGVDMATKPSANGIMLATFENVSSGTGAWWQTVDLTWAYLIEKFHQYNRPFLDAYVDISLHYTFLSRQKNVIRENIIIKHCCEDGNFDLSRVIDTEWGEAEIVEAEEDIYKDTIELKLALESPC